MMKRSGLLLALVLDVGGVAANPSGVSVEAPVEPALTSLQSGRTPAVGLSLWFEDGVVRRENGTPKTIDLYGDARFFVQELDLTAQATTTTDQGIAPIIASGDLADLDWAGVRAVDEDWRPELGSNPRTYTRSIFYRGARWMDRNSVFQLVPLDARGGRLGAPIIAIAGADDRARSSDDGFVRRFVARQITRGCRAIGDCAGATSFTAQALVQVRNAQNAAQRARSIPTDATELALVWTEQPRRTRKVAIQRRPESASPYRYGLALDLALTRPPANGQFFMPGESVGFRITYRDGAGTRLHPAGSLPAYADFAADEIPSGIRYYDGFQQLLTLYYALKNREGNTMWSLSGPTNLVKNTRRVQSDLEFFFLSGTQIPTATVAESGFTAFFDVVPSVARTLDPVLSTQPLPDTFEVALPADALPGTYTLTWKGRRDWGGEAINASTTIELRVGRSAPTTFAPTTGRCSTCHNGDASLAKLLHGNDDRRTCYGCHVPLESEPDQALDYRAHLIHTRSQRFDANPYDCRTCHLTVPAGPPRGFPGIGP